MAGESGGSGLADVGAFLGDIADFGTSLFGESSGVSGSQSGTQSGTSKSSAIQTEQLELDQAAVQRIIEDVLGGPQGLASIFGEEQASGIFNSSVSKQAAGNLTAKLVGELAKLTAKKTATTDKETEQESATTAQSGQTSEKKGLLEGIGDFFGF